jgi:hypothetical protein
MQNSSKAENEDGAQIKGQCSEALVYPLWGTVSRDDDEQNYYDAQ